MAAGEVFYLQKGNVYAVPIIHYNMESAAQVRLAFLELAPDCVAVELAETMQLQLLHAASRLPDISLVMTYDQKDEPLYYMCEPCDAAFEGVRSALEKGISAYCIDLDVDEYPDIKEMLPDPYAIKRIGLKDYYETYRKIAIKEHQQKTAQDKQREIHMARKLKELSCRYQKVLFIGGMAHVQDVLKLLERDNFPTVEHAQRDRIELCTLTEESAREATAECGWINVHYERAREGIDFPPDRQKLFFQLVKEAGVQYTKSTGNPFPGYHLRTIMKFARNYALITNALLPDLYQLLCAAKGCVDHNFAYETWLLATQCPYLKNVDNLPALNIKIDEIWGHSKIIRFHMRQPSRKKDIYKRRAKDKGNVKFNPPGPFSLCSYPPEDLIIENFGRFLQKKGTQILMEESSRTIPFTASIEDGLDTKETIRHWHEKKLYVRASGKPPGGVGSIVIIFDTDAPADESPFKENFPWKMTWVGEHAQESDMAFYATEMKENVVGPGISRCEYGGLMMSYPPRRVWDVWHDPDYHECRNKPEVLLMAAIDYAMKPLVVYVAAKPPRSFLKSFAGRFGKKIVYIPIGQLSPVTLNKLRTFHVLDGYDKRKSADEYIY